jgi:hypothetical protein
MKDKGKRINFPGLDSLSCTRNHCLLYGTASCKTDGSVTHITGKPGHETM